MAVELTGFQKPLNPSKHKPVGLARITFGKAAGREVAECSCQWVSWHTRLKVLEDRVDRHINKQHGGRGIRL